MGWVDRNDREQKCGGSPGPVGDGDRVARITIHQSPATGYQPFQRKDLIKPSAAFEDECGTADGLSVDLCTNLTPEDLLQRSARRAAAANARRAQQGKPPNQFPLGALLASVSELRSLGSRFERQVIYVYDDPISDGGAIHPNPEHSVIRISDIVPEEQVAGVIDDVVQAFSLDGSRVSTSSAE